MMSKSSRTKLIYPIMLKVGVWAIILIILTGCATFQQGELANSATNFNLTVEKAQNEMLLLNIIRSSKRHPMYFTDFSQLRGNISYEYRTGNIPIPVGNGASANGIYTVTPGLTYLTNPSFDLKILNDQEFIRGIMTPVPMETVYYYQEQGWPREMLLSLLIERIELKGASTYDNYPGTESTFNEFQNYIKANDCMFIASETIVFIDGPKITNTDATLEQQLNTQKVGLKLKKNNDNSYQLISTEKNYFLRCSSSSSTTYFISSQASNNNGVVYIRSPEAILYYLGEIVRAETKNKDSYQPKIIPMNASNTSNASCTKKVTLFNVNKKINTAPSVTVMYQGTNYSIPEIDFEQNCPTDRSMDVLSFLTQIIGLQKKIDSAPATGVVNIIGR